MTQIWFNPWEAGNYWYSVWGFEDLESDGRLVKNGEVLIMVVRIIAKMMIMFILLPLLLLDILKQTAFT